MSAVCCCCTVARKLQKQEQNKTSLIPLLQAIMGGFRSCGRPYPATQRTKSSRFELHAAVTNLPVKYEYEIRVYEYEQTIKIPTED